MCFRPSSLDVKKKCPSCGSLNPSKNDTCESWDPSFPLPKHPAPRAPLALPKHPAPRERLQPLARPASREHPVR